ncbi:hypothetical protein V8C26DRAFT_398407 [Trichoderma gracile]
MRQDEMSTAEASSDCFRLAHLQGVQGSQTGDMNTKCRDRTARSYSHEPPSLAPVMSTCGPHNRHLRFTLDTTTSCTR